MMLTQRASALAARIKQLEELTASHKNLEGLQTRAAQLAKGATPLTGQAMAHRCLRGRQIAVEIPVATAQDLRRKVRELQQAFEAEPSSIVTAVNPRNDVWTQLATFPTAVDASLRNGWTAYVDSKAKIDTASWLDTVGDVPQLKSKIADFRALQRQVTDARGRLPTVAADVDRFDRLVDRLQNAWRMIREVLEGPEGVISDEVLTFLQQAMSRDGARWHHLTPAVIQWLAGQHADAAVRIYLGDPRLMR